MEIDKVSTSATQNIQPVRFLEIDDPIAHPTPGMALCLSGGGYRTMLFHLGATSTRALILQDGSSKLLTFLSDRNIFPPFSLMG